MVNQQKFKAKKSRWGGGGVNSRVKNVLIIFEAGTLKNLMMALSHYCASCLRTPAHGHTLVDDVLYTFQAQPYTEASSEAEMLKTFVRIKTYGLYAKDTLGIR